jgi:hypothetical protein
VTCRKFDFHHLQILQQQLAELNQMVTAFSGRVFCRVFSVVVVGGKEWTVVVMVMEWTGALGLTTVVMESTTVVMESTTAVMESTTVVMLGWTGVIVMMGWTTGVIVMMEL